MISFLIFCAIYYSVVWLLFNPKHLKILGKQIIKISNHLKDL